jgi:uracil-DNA glycosylase
VSGSAAAHTGSKSRRAHAARYLTWIKSPRLSMTGGAHRTLDTALFYTRLDFTHWGTGMARDQQTAEPFVPKHGGLAAIETALPNCRGCELYRFAIQAVGGRGPAKARLMLVGEQPGDQEDKQGQPFVGPAGKVLDRALEELRIPRAAVYLTNAVKHFKFEERGKLRLHKAPRMSEIVACRPWLEAEIAVVKPKVVLCLGASASKSLLGGTFALMRSHGQEIRTVYAERVFATIHPSAVLRARDEAGRRELRTFLEDDLAKAWKAAKD